MIEAWTAHKHQDRTTYHQHRPSINKVAIYQGLLAKFSYDSHLIFALRFITCDTIGLLTSGCHNRQYLCLNVLQMQIEKGIVIIVRDLFISQETVKIRESLNEKGDWNTGII